MKREEISVPIPNLRLAAIAALIALSPPAAAARDDGAMTVTIRPGPMDEAAGRGFVDVALTLPADGTPAGAPLLAMPVVLANTESAARALTGIEASDAAGPLDLVAKDDPEALVFHRHWTASRAVVGTLHVRYRAPVDNTPPRRGSGPPIMLRIDGDGFSGAGNMFLMLPEAKTPYPITIDWDLSQMAPGATATSSYGEGDVALPAGPADRLARTVFMAGHMSREPAAVTGKGFSAAWLGQPPFDPHPLMQWTHRLHGWMARFFEDEGEPPYRVFLRFNPINAGGGTALINSFLTTYNAATTADSVKGTLAHEMVHTWTSNGPGQWYGEGIAVHYQALLPWRAGLIGTQAFLDDLNETASRYYSNALNDVPNDQIAPRFWEDTRIRTLPYDRGGLYFAIIDARIRKASGGKRSLDDLVRTMIGRARAGQPVDEAAWLGLLAAEAGPEALALHKSMMEGGLMLPESGDFGPCFARTTKTIPRFELGFDPRSLVGDVKTIKGLVPGSAAERAGLRNGDVVTYRQALDALQGDVRAELTLFVTRDGREFKISYLPRGEEVEIYQWARVEAIPETMCKY